MQRSLRRDAARRILSGSERRALLEAGLRWNLQHPYN